MKLWSVGNFVVLPKLEAVRRKGKSCLLTTQKESDDMYRRKEISYNHAKKRLTHKASAAINTPPAPTPMATKPVGIATTPPRPTLCS
jgi:hypothetical protein